MTGVPATNNSQPHTQEGRVGARRCAMVLPIALGAAMAASCAVLKAKCTLIVAGEGCSKQRKRDPWAPQVSNRAAPCRLAPEACCAFLLTPHILSQVDLRDDAEKRRDAQQKLQQKRDEAFSAAEEVQLVSEKIYRVRLHLLGT